VRSGKWQDNLARSRDQQSYAFIYLPAHDGRIEVHMKD
jgi:hypothetical protein